MALRTATALKYASFADLMRAALAAATAAGDRVGAATVAMRAVVLVVLVVTAAWAGIVDDIKPVASAPVRTSVAGRNRRWACKSKGSPSRCRPG